MKPDSLPIRVDTDCLAGEAYYNCRANSDLCAHSQCPDINFQKEARDSGEKIQPVNEDEEQLWPPTSSTSSHDMKTDSGITHTVPNDDIVTVTKHTLITTGKPPETTSTAVPFTSVSGKSTAGVSDPPDLPPTETSGLGGSAANGSGSFPIGAIIGVAVGGVALIVITVAAFFFIKRRRQNAHKSSTNAGAYSGNGRDDFFDDKHFPQSMSPHTTGTQDAGDPFAPFGGRADEPQLPCRARDGAVEMDATSTAPVELPAEAASADARPAQGSTTEPPVTPVIQTPSKDPCANLNTLRSENGQPAYVNQWNQYRAMAE